MGLRPPRREIPATLRTLPPRAGVGSGCKVLATQAPVFGSLDPTESQVQ